MNEKIDINLKEFFMSNRTKDIDFRIKQLKNLYKVFKKYEPQIVQSLQDDLKKPDYEIYTTETGMVLKEINYLIKNIKRWAKPEIISTPLYLKPSKGYILKEPYGTVLIIVPFNYPFQLTFVPLAGAISAGNCAVIRPSKKTPNCNKVIFKIISETYDENYIKCILPDEISSSDLLSNDFDYIFFTGSSTAGKKTAKAAAEKLIPYTLELGGKSPVIVDKDVNLKQAANKIVWGKFLNAGQTCIAPDFVLVDNEIIQKFNEEIIKTIKNFYGSIACESKDYGRIIDIEAFKRLTDIILQENENIIYGGKFDERDLYIEPVVLNINSFNTPSMQEEIFGPILPVLTYTSIDDVIFKLNQLPEPLALYVFSRNKEFYEKIIKNIQFGGGAVNDTIEHISSEKMPFGGIGNSGIGNYHGKFSFDTFSHKKSILVKNPNLDLKIMYPPYNNSLIKKFRFLFS